MKIMKLLASCAMVGALTAVCASGAFAEVTGTITDISYTAEDATAGTSATVTFNIDNYNVAGGDYTVLVLNKNVDGSVISDDIVQIDQLTNTTTATNKTMSVSLVLPDDINNSEKKSADGTYYVRVGGNADGYIDTTFTVGSTGGEEKPQVWIGNVNADEAINALDLTEVAKHIAEFDSTLKASEVNMAAAAYCTGDEIVNALDLTEVAKHIAEFETEYVNTTVDLGTYATVE